MKKKILTVLFIVFLLLPALLRCQDCATINGFTKFHGLQFSGHLPDSVKNCFNLNAFTQKKGYLEYDLPVSLPRNKSVGIKHYLYENDAMSSRFSRWFYFGDEVFSRVYVSCLLDGRIYEFSMLKDLHDRAVDDSYLDDSVAITTNKLPPTYLKISDQLTALFGDMSKEDNKWVLNDFFRYNRHWQCDKNEIDLILTYFPSENASSFGLSIQLVITDKTLEKIQKLNELGN
jgi:hypothetical protein